MISILPLLVELWGLTISANYINFNLFILDLGLYGHYIDIFWTNNKFSFPHNYPHTSGDQNILDRGLAPDHRMSIILYQPSIVYFSREQIFS